METSENGHRVIGLENVEDGVASWLDINEFGFRSTYAASVVVSGALTDLAELDRKSDVLGLLMQCCGVDLKELLTEVRDCIMDLE